MFDTSLEALGLYAGVNILCSMTLGIRAGFMRRKLHIGIGYGENPTLERAVRAHANNIEYVPLALVGLGILYLLGAEVEYIHAVGVLLTLGRIIHAVTYSRSVRTIGRPIGMFMTWLSMLMIAGACLYLGGM